MILRPPTIYKCPQCAQKIARGGIASGNTFGARRYSDAKMIAPMMPEFPQLTICDKCKKIFWIKDAEAVGEKRTGERKSTFFSPFQGANKEMPDARFLDRGEYFLALTLGDVCRSPEEEMYIRIKIWRSYNDIVRDIKDEALKKKTAVFYEEDAAWRENCLRLIELLDSGTTEHKIMIAELRRNLGEFEEAVAILKTIINPNFNQVAREIKEKAFLRDTVVFELSAGRRW